MPPIDPENSTQPAGVSGKRVVVVGGLAMLAVFVAMAIGYGLVPGWIDARRQASRVGCADHLRAIHSAAQQYATDGGRFPHIRALNALDGAADTADTPRVWRELVARDYLDPAQLICPAKPRLRRAQRSKTDDQSAWLRGSQTHSAPSLVEAVDLSYGWTRRSLSPNANPSSLLAADKAVVTRRGAEGGMKGNHTDGWSVLRLSGAVEWLGTDHDPFPGSWLTRTHKPSDGFLSIAEQADRSQFR